MKADAGASVLSEDAGSGEDTAVSENAGADEDATAGEDAAAGTDVGSTVDVAHFSSLPTPFDVDCASDGVAEDGPLQTVNVNASNSAPN